MTILVTLRGSGEVASARSSGKYVLAMSLDAGSVTR